MPEPKTVRPPHPQTYRPPRVIGYDEDEGVEQEENGWSDSSPEDDGDQKEDAVEVAGPVNANANNIPVLHVQSQPPRIGRRHHHRVVNDQHAVASLPEGHKQSSSNRQAGYVRTPQYAGSSGIRSGPGGQAIRYGERTGPAPPNDQSPFAPRNTEPSGHYAPNQFPGNSYFPPFPPDPYAGGLPYQTPLYPSKPYPPNDYYSPIPPMNPPHQTPLYPPRQYPPADYHLQHPPINNLPMHNYPPNLYAVNSPTALPLYEGFPHSQQQPPVVIRDTAAEYKLKQVTKELTQMKADERARQRKEKQRLIDEEYAREQAAKAAAAAQRKEMKRRKQEALDQQAENRAMQEKKDLRHVGRGLRVQELRTEVGKKEVEEVVREATDYITRIGRQGRDSLRLEEKRHVDDDKDVLLEVVQFVEDRLRRQGKRSLEERSMGSNRSRRLQVVQRAPEPVPARVDPLTRIQIEDVVLDLLDRLSVRGQIQESAFNSEASTTVSAGQSQSNRARRLERRTKSDFDESYVGHHEQRYNGWRYDSREGKERDHPTSPTAANDSDEVSNGSASRERVVGLKRSHRSSDPGVGADRNQDSPPPLPSHVPRNNVRLEGQQAQAVGRRGPAVRSVTSGPGQERIMDADQKHIRKRWDASIVDRSNRDLSSSDESPDRNLYPVRSSRYAIAQPNGSRRREAPHLPVVPDPPQAENKPNQGSRRAHVATDVEDNDQ